MHKALPPDSDLEIDPESSEGLGVNCCEEPNSVQSTALSLSNLQMFLSVEARYSSVQLDNWHVDVGWILCCYLMKVEEQHP